MLGEMLFLQKGASCEKHKYTRQYVLHARELVVEFEINFSLETCDYSVWSKNNCAD